jgi:hypothetical protein
MYYYYSTKHEEGLDIDNPKIPLYVSSPGAEYIPKERDDHCVPRRAGGGR